jgi:hypothetical protein
LLLLFVGIGIAVRHFLPQPSFDLLAPQLEAAILSAGTDKSVSIFIERQRRFHQAVHLEASSEGDGLTPAAADIAADSDRGEVILHAAAGAAPGLRRVHVRASAKGEPQKTISFQVVILPFGFEPIGDKPPDGREMPYPATIIRRVGEQKVVFVFVQPEGKADAPFYLLENKVTNGVFHVFADTNRQAVDGAVWKQGGIANGRDVGDDDELPVFRVTRPEAVRCAAWLGGLLPRARQLDLAFGYDGRPKPDFPKVAAVHRLLEGPRTITESSKDRSPNGICDLSGNGREWTRDDMTSEDGKRLAVLRGHSYTTSEPLTFADLDKWIEDPAICPVLSPDYRSWTTSFRVVIELASQLRDN